MLLFLPPPRLLHHFSPTLPAFFPPLELFPTLLPPLPPSSVRVPLLWISFVPAALLMTVDTPDEIPFRCAESPGGCDLLLCL